MHPPRVSLEKWQGGKRAALSLMFDGWTPGQAAIAAPALEARGLPATFFVTLLNFGANPGFDHFGELQRLARAGHEIGNKTRSFPDLTRASAAALHDEVEEARLDLEEGLYGVQVRSFSYPFGKWDPQVLAAVERSHSAARGYQDSATWQEGYDLSVTGQDRFHVAALAMNTLSEQRKLGHHLANAIEQGGYLPCAFQGIYGARLDRDKAWYGSLPEAELLASLDTIEARADDLWVTTFGAAVAYRRSVAATTVVVRPRAPHVYTLELEVDASADAWGPITLRLDAEEGAWRVARAGETVPLTWSAGVTRFTALPGETLSLHANV